jgi:hypothetical protein
MGFCLFVCFWILKLVELQAVFFFFFFFLVFDFVIVFLFFCLVGVLKFLGIKLLWFPHSTTLKLCGLVFVLLGF